MKTKINKLFISLMLLLLVANPLRAEDEIDTVEEITSSYPTIQLEFDPTWYVWIEVRTLNNQLLNGIDFSGTGAGQTYAGTTDSVTGSANDGFVAWTPYIQDAPEEYRIYAKILLDGEFISFQIIQ